MKHITAIVLFTLSVQGALACPHDLRGTWQSDREASMTFARENARLQPKTEAFLAALYGHMTLTFTRSEAHLVMPDIEVPVSGESRPFVGFDQRTKYKVLFCNSTMLVWSGKMSFDSEPKASTLVFLDPNTFWVYAGGADPKVPDLHTREFFRRLK